jgi:hypothetical protein
MVKADNGSILDEAHGGVVPGIRALNLTIRTQRLSLVLHDEHVILILVGIESNLLLLAAGGVHVVVRVQITTLGVVVTNADTGAEGNVRRHILHGLGVQRSLELRRHEAITFSRVDQAEEVNTEHGHVETQGNDNQTKNAGEEVLEPQSLDPSILALQSLSTRLFQEHTGVTVFESPSTTQSWRTVRDPTQAMVKRPTHLTLRVAPRETPVAASQNHHGPLKAEEGPNSCWFVKQLKVNAVRAVKKMRGESNRIRRD